VLLVGSGSEETALKRQIAEAGITDICVFTGSVPHREAGDYMRCLDAFVLPSKTMPNWKEQFGRVIIEAMACQVPVIGSDSGQIPHLIQETGGGLVFPESSPVALAAHLQTLIQNPEIHNHLGKTGREAVCSRYTYEAIAAQLYEILQSVTKSGNNPEHQVTLQVTNKIC
jgi:glycosyltransferase involved in cell wall biosynthesis